MMVEDLYLSQFPLRFRSLCESFSSYLCLQAIWIGCKLDHSFEDIQVSGLVRDALLINKLVFNRGIKELTRTKVITIRKESGKRIFITLNPAIIEDKDKEFILKGRGK